MKNSTLETYRISYMNSNGLTTADIITAQSSTHACAIAEDRAYNSPEYRNDVCKILIENVELMSKYLIDGTK